MCIHGPQPGRRASYGAWHGCCNLGKQSTHRSRISTPPRPAASPPQWIHLKVSILLAFAALLSSLALASPAFGMAQESGPICDTVPPSKSPPDSTNSPKPKPGSTGTARPPLTTNPPGLTTWSPGSGALGSLAGNDSIEDLTRWELWWKINKSQYLDLKATLRSPKPVQDDCDWFLGKGDGKDEFIATLPTKKQICDIAVPTLLKILTEDCSDQLTGDTLIALAKIGETGPLPNHQSLESVIRPFLSHNSQSVSETAALALGILGRDASSAILLQLTGDDPAARKYADRPTIPMRTRVFAAYALGLIGHRTSSNTLRQQIATRLAAILNGPNFAASDLKIAAMVSFGLTPIDLKPLASAGVANAPTPGVIQSRQNQLEFLLGYIDLGNSRKRKQDHHDSVRAHASTALARLLNRNGLELNRQREIVIGKLLEAIDKHSKHNRTVQQSCILALGQLVDSRGGRNPHSRTQVELQRIGKSGETQAKRFALISLAQIAARPAPAGIEDPIGGRGHIQKFLVTCLAKSKGSLAPWAGLAMGIYARALADNRQETLSTGSLAALTSAAKANNSPEFVGAYMIALGLASDLDASELILKKFGQFSEGEVRGHCAVALGLMNEQAAVEPIQDALGESNFRPGLMNPMVTSLGLLGDGPTAEFLLHQLDNTTSSATQAAIASALGTLGDGRAIDRLAALLADSEKTHIVRARAAMALGMICDKESVPWNACIQLDVNYLTPASTFSSLEGSGVLDRR